MPDDSPLDDFAVRTYEVAVPVDTSVFDAFPELESAVVSTVAGTLVEDVDQLDFERSDIDD
ncbi:hypothetical protein ACOZ35_01860 [Halorubrum xinjiangense]|uniref:hypothetical protein n=1 Tax=Halorubrum xinjiangense TaxID=261291 RepID=UPI003C6EF1CE